VKPGIVYGYLRLKREGAALRSYFKFRDDRTWDELGFIATRQ